MRKRDELEELASVLEAEGWSVTPPERLMGDFPESFRILWEKCRPYTLISPERGWALREAVGHVCANDIPGDIVECGVWKGGACLLASEILSETEKDSSRRIWLYDTFSGMPEPGEEDRIASSGQSLSERDPEGWWAAGMDEVKTTLNGSSLGTDRFVFVPGRVENTLERTVPDAISVLRLDTDWYESTRRELETLYPRLSPGGVLIIDDYGHFTGARKAVDEYFEKLGLRPLVHRSDYTGRVIVKD